MLSNYLKEFLTQEKIKYTSISHSAAHTAQQTAQAAHMPGNEMAKTIIVKLDGELAMAVLPAPDHIDLELLKGATGSEQVNFATELEFKNRFSECEIGAMPPFGNLYHMDVYVEEKLSDNEKILFNACSHTELIEMSYKDYARIVKPKVIRIVVFSTT